MDSNNNLNLVENVENEEAQAEESFEGKMFVGGLSWETTADSLKYYFQKFGDLIDVALMSDKRTGQPRGFGFVTYKDPAGCSTCFYHTV
jgi:RNA recognition motif-containing protein